MDKYLSALDALNKIEELKDFNQFSLSNDLSMLNSQQLRNFEILMNRIIGIVDELKIKIDINPQIAISIVIDKARLIQFKKEDKNGK